MRIDRNFSSEIKRQVKGSKLINPSARKGEVDFKEKLEEIKSQEVREKLDRLLSIIEEQGEKLKKSLDKRDLMEYKNRVKEFLIIIQKEFARTRQSFSWDGRGNMKTYTIINKVDKNLEILHNLFMEEQADALEVLKKVDEIRGLLLDLYI